MDRAYFQLITAATEAQILTIAICKNADYKQAIKAATDPLLVDCLKEVQRLTRCLTEVINRQEYANVQSMPG